MWGAAPDGLIAGERARSWAGRLSGRFRRETCAASRRGRGHGRRARRHASASRIERNVSSRGLPGSASGETSTRPGRPDVLDAAWGSAERLSVERASPNESLTVANAAASRVDVPSLASRASRRVTLRTRGTARGKKIRLDFSCRSAPRVTFPPDSPQRPTRGNLPNPGSKVRFARFVSPDPRTRRNGSWPNFQKFQTGRDSPVESRSSGGVVTTVTRAGHKPLRSRARTDDLRRCRPRRSSLRRRPASLRGRRRESPGRCRHRHAREVQRQRARRVRRVHLGQGERRATTRARGGERSR